MCRIKIMKRCITKGHSFKNDDARDLHLKPCYIPKSTEKPRAILSPSKTEENKKVFKVFTIKKDKSHGNLFPHKMT
ncbi:MAG: hypothetical protein ACTSYC_02115 [Promethearchaeota archaeon]